MSDGNIHADGIVIRFDHPNAKSVLEPAQLFELLDALEFAWRKRGIFEQRFAAEAIQTEMLPVRAAIACGSFAHPGNRGAGKIKRVAFEIAHYLDDVRIHDVVRLIDGGARRGNLHGFIFEHRGDHRIDVPGSIKGSSPCTFT